MANRITLHDKSFELYIPGSEISAAIHDIARQLNRDLQHEDTPPVFVSVLNGSFMFTAELMKYIDFDCHISFVKLSSYAGTASQGKVRELIGLNSDLTGKTAILLEDVVDSGVTIEHLVNTLQTFNPRTLKIAAMLLKPGVYKKNIPIDYVGLSIPDDFIVGYGLDYNELGRNYGDIYKLT
jgi:hypoxanthine phosphoribosyltransferase